jgi:putative addiction module component (TIGR02574 family)
MSAHLALLTKEAKKLSPAERAELVDELLASLGVTNAELDRLWSEEAERRLADYRLGRAQSIDAATLLDTLRRRAR